jgi:hypothetical protein
VKSSEVKTPFSNTAVAVIIPRPPLQPEKYVSLPTILNVPSLFLIIERSTSLRQYDLLLARVQQNQSFFLSAPASAFDISIIVDTTNSIANNRFIFHFLSIS